MDKRCSKILKTNYFKKIISNFFFWGMRQTQKWVRQIWKNHSTIK